MKLKTEKRRIDRLRSEVAAAEQTHKREKKALKEAETDHDQCVKAQEIVQLTAESVQEKAHAKISEVVSSCLSSVFEEDAYEFRIRFERKRGKTEAILLFERDGMEVDPLSASGGGAVDVAAFALRVACLILSRPHKRRLVVLDEPFKFVSRQYREAVKLMLESLAKDMKIQIVMVTHIDELETGEIIEI